MLVMSAKPVPVNDTTCPSTRPVFGVTVMVGTSWAPGPAPFRWLSDLSTAWCGEASGRPSSGADGRTGCDGTRVQAWARLAGRL
jgi:hypothetical protein